MLDSDSTDLQQSNSADQAGAATVTEEKPVRRRAPRKKTAAADKTAPADQAAPTDQTAPTDKSPESGTAAERPAKTARRSRKAAAEPVAASDQAAEAPAPRRRSRKTAQPAVEPPAEKAAEPSGEPQAAEPAGEPHAAPALAAPAAVLFVAPAEKERPARSRRKPKAEAPAAAAPAEPAQQAAPVAPAEPVAPAQPAEPEESDDSEDLTEEGAAGKRRRRRGRRGRGGRTRDAGDATEGTESEFEAESADADEVAEEEAEAEDGVDTDQEEQESTSSRRRRRRRRRSGTTEAGRSEDDPPNTVVHVREARSDTGMVRGVKGSTRLEAKRQRRREGRDSGRRRPQILTEAEFLARREAVDRAMVVRQHGDRTQVAVLEDGILVEHYVTRASSTSYVGNVYLGRVQNVLPSMEAAFVDIGKGRNGVLYAGEVNWDAAGLEGQARAIENALKSGDTVLVQVTKDPIGHKGARLTSQVSLPGRFLVYVPGGGMTGISRKLPDTERRRLKAILKEIVPEDAGVIIRTAAEGATEEELTHDVERLQAQWQAIEAKAAHPKSAPTLVYGEPDLAIRVVRDVFNEDFGSLIVQGGDVWHEIESYVKDVAPDLLERVHRHTGESDIFADLRVAEQLSKALDRKVWLPSGGSLVIDRTEAMTVVDVNTGKFTGSGGNLEETVTRNNLEAAEEIVRQLRLRDVGGIVVIDFIDMVLESNRELVLRRLTECLGRDRTKHQVAEVTSLGLVQMTRKRVGEGLLEAFSETCPTCGGRGLLVHTEPTEGKRGEESSTSKRAKRGKAAAKQEAPQDEPDEDPVVAEERRRAAAAAIANIAKAAANHEEEVAGEEEAASEEELSVRDEFDEDAVATVIDLEEPIEVAESVSPRPRRRRRAASRPAGPPVIATD